MYRQGQGVIRNTKEGFKYYKFAADRGYAPAQSNLGICYECGYGIAQNSIEAVKWYRLSAEQGYAQAEFDSVDGPQSVGRQ